MKLGKHNSTKAVKCPICGGDIDLKQNEEEIVKCPYCGNTFDRSDLLEESDAVKTERIRSKAYKDVELEKQKLEKERLEFEKAESDLNETNRRIKDFRHSKIRKAAIWLMILSILGCVGAFAVDAVAAGLLGILIVILYILCLLLGSQTIKEKHRGMHTLVFIIALVLAIPFLLAFSESSGTVDTERYKWSDIILHEYLPEPKSKIAEIVVNSDDMLSMDIYKTSKEQYQNYVDACKDMGYTIDLDQDSDTMNAYNEEGYELSLMFYENDKIMSVDLDTPVEMSQITWPQGALAQTIPQPKSLEGKIQTDSESNLFIYIGKTSESDFNEYIDACASAGYTVDYDRGDTWYQADNADGCHLSLQYKGFNTMIIEVYAAISDGDTQAAAETAAVQETETAAETAAAQDSGEVTPEFKDAMDSYEKAIDDYIDFCKTYDSNTTDIEMLNKYNNLLQQYTDAMEKLDAVDESTLSAADDAYYLEVMTRVNQKLLELDQ